MVQPVLKMMTSPDLFDLEEGAVPPDAGSFAILVQCQIGLEGPAADTFDVVVLTPDQIADQIDASGVLAGRGYLVMRHYDLDLLRRTITQWCRAAEAPDWEGSAAYLGRYMLWEFERR